MQPLETGDAKVHGKDALYVALVRSIESKIMRALDELIRDLEAKADDNKTLEAQHLKPKNEDLIIESLLALATEIKQLKQRQR